MQKLLPFLLLICLRSAAQTPAHPAQTPIPPTQAPASLSQTPATPALFKAIRSGDSASLNQQLVAGANPNDSLDGYSALMAATVAGSATQMRQLIDHGANVNYQNAQQITALWLAVPDREKTTLLLHHGADPRHRIQGYSILVKCAYIPGSADLLQLLISKGADPQHRASDNILLYNAAISGDTANLGFVMRLGFKAGDSVSFGDFPINSAQSFRTFSTVKMLVDSGADPNARSMYFQTLPAQVGFTPLMTAALNADKPSFFYLLDHGADPNLKSKLGMTALMLLQLSETDDTAMTLALLKHGADASAKTPAGTDALSFAIKTGHTRSAALIKQNDNH
jgi:ankyrin repeat protein